MSAFAINLVLALVLAWPMAWALMIASGLVGAITSPSWRHNALTVFFWAGALLPSVIALSGVLPERAEDLGTVYLRKVLFRLLPEQTPGQPWILRAAVLVLCVFIPGAVAAVMRWAMALRRTLRLSKATSAIAFDFRDGLQPVLVSPLVASPMLVGFRRPVIVLPEHLPCAGDEDTIALICAHEHAHARRCDNWRLAAEYLALALFWWCRPLARMHARLLAAREEVCDAEALRGASDRQRVAYSRLVLYCLGQASAAPAMAAGMGGSLDAARQRIQRILGAVDTPRQACEWRPFAALAMGVAVCMIVPLAHGVGGQIETLAGLHGESLWFEPIDGTSTYRVREIGGVIQARDGNHTAAYYVTRTRMRSGQWRVELKPAPAGPG